MPEEAHGTRKKVFLIFLFGIFVLLGIFIGQAIYDTYKTSKFVVNETGNPKTMECIGYAFGVKNPVYEDGVLRFTLENKPYGDLQIEKIVVEAGNITRDMEIKNLMPGLKFPVEFGMYIEDEYLVYPAGCKIYAKTFNLKT